MGGGSKKQKVTQTTEPWGPQGTQYQQLYDTLGGTQGSWQITDPTAFYGGASTTSSPSNKFRPFGENAEQSYFEKNRNNPTAYNAGRAGLTWVEGKKGLKDMPLQYYGGPTVAGFSPEQEQALGIIQRRINTGPNTSLMRNTAEGGYLGRSPDISLMKSTAEGKYLSPDTNPWLKSFYDKAAEEALPGIDSNAVNAGRYGGSSWALKRGRAEGDLASGIYGNAYQTERERQAQAQQYLTGLGESAYQTERDRQAQAQQYLTGLGEDVSRYNLEQLGNAGAQTRAYEQAQMDAAKAAFEWNQMEPWKRAEMYARLIGGNLGSVQSQPMYGPSPTQGALGGAMAGAAAGSSVGGYGALAGGVIGGLGGYYANQ